MIKLPSNINLSFKLQISDNFRNLMIQIWALLHANHIHWIVYCSFRTKIFTLLLSFSKPTKFITFLMIIYFEYIQTFRWFRIILEYWEWYKFFELNFLIFRFYFLIINLNNLPFLTLLAFGSTTLNCWQEKRSFS